MLLVGLSLLAGQTYSDPQRIADTAADAPLPPIRTDASSITGRDHFFVKSFALEGNTLFSREQLAPIITPYENRRIDATELHELTRQLTLNYVQHGFTNSGVVVNDQEMENGVVVLQAVEGRLAEVRVAGNKSLSADYITRRLHQTPSSVFNVKTLGAKLKQLQKNPRIERVKADIQPGIERGTAVLNMQVEESQPYHLRFSVDNHLSPNVGDTQGKLDFNHLNLFGFGDTLVANYTKAEGLDSGELMYTVPLNRHDTSLTFRYSKLDSEVVAKPFDQIDITGDTARYGISLRHPFVYSANSELAFGLSLAKRNSRSYLLGEPYSFSAGVDQGRSEATIVDVFQEWVYRGEKNVFALYSSLSAGLENHQNQSLNASGEDAPTGKYQALLLQWQWLRRIGLWNSTLKWRNGFRIATDPLLAPEQFAIGGADSVRGYRQNLLTRDNGIVSSLEWRIPVVNSMGDNPHAVEIAPFVDFGQGWDTNNSSKTRRSISSVGLNLRWDFAQRYHLALAIAHAFDDDVVAIADSDLQDDGIHFQLSAELL